MNVPEEYEPEPKICGGCKTEYKPPVLQHDQAYCKSCFKKKLEKEDYDVICEWSRYVKAT